MKGNILYTPKGGTQQQVATPFKKHYTTEDYISCVHGQECAIYIKNQKMLNVHCSYRSSINIWVGFSIGIHLFLMN